MPGGLRDLVLSPGNPVSWAQPLSPRVPMSWSCREEEGGTGGGALHPDASVRTPGALEVMLVFQFPFTFKMEVYLFLNLR